MTSLAYFQDRETAIAAFERLWDAPQPWILAFTGFSGQGKTTLLEYLEVRHCQTQKIPYARIGLSGFSAAIREAFHHMLESPSATLRASLPAERVERYQRSRHDALEMLNRRRAEIRQVQVMRGAPEGEQVMSANVAEAYREMERQADDPIFDAWLDCMAGLAGAARVVLLLDDYDLFQNQAAVEDLERFWGVLARARGRLPGLRVVLASREKIRHRSRIYALQNGLQSDGLLPLSPADSEALLAALGVTDAAYRQAVYQRLAQGHPLVTRMAAEAWLETAGGIPVDEVPRLTHREQAVEWVQGRILDRLAGAQKQAARWAALLRWFEAENLGAILETAFSEDDFTALRGLAFIGPSRVREGKWACHDLVRRVQSGYLQRAHPQGFRRFHQRARNWYTAHDEALEALYHHFFIEPEEAFEAWKALESRAAFHFDHETWAALTELALAPELPLEDAAWAEVRYRAGRRHYYRAEWQAAEKLFAQALERYHAIGDRLGQANVLQAIGDVQQFRKELDAALESYAQALERYHAIGDRLGQANVYLSLGKLHLQQEEQESRRRGADYLEQALRLYREIGDRAGQTNVYVFRAQFLAAQAQFEAALEYARRALALAMEFIPAHPFTQRLAGFVRALEERL